MQKQLMTASVVAILQLSLGCGHKHSGSGGDSSPPAANPEVPLNQPYTLAGSSADNGNALVDPYKPSSTRCSRSR